MLWLKGYTLIELAMVLLVAALIAGTVTPVYLHIINNKRIDLAVSELTSMQKDIDRYRRKNLHYPDTLAELYPSIPVDPWGSPYQYLGINNIKATQSGLSRTDAQFKKLNGDYDLFSAGANGSSMSIITAEVSKDDVIRGHNGNYVGLANEYN